MLKLELVSDVSGFEKLKNDWDALLPRNATNEVFLTWVWQTTWWEVYQPGTLTILVARTDDGTLAGIAPWFIDATTRALVPIGGFDVTDYQDVIVAPDQADAFAAALAEWLSSHTDQFAALRLCNIPAASPTLESLPRRLTERGFFVETAQIDVCPIIRLPATFEAFVESLDKKNRHELRRKLRRAEESDDEKVDWYIVGAEHNLEHELDCFIHLMAMSHPDKAEFLRDPKNIAFFRAIMPKMSAHGWLQLAFLRVNGECAAAYISFDYQNRIGLYNSGLLPQAYSQLSLGIVLLARIIEHAINHKKTIFDFLRGNEVYKYRMGGVDTAVLELRATLPDKVSA